MVTHIDGLHQENVRETVILLGFLEHSILQSMEMLQGRKVVGHLPSFQAGYLHPEPGGPILLI